MSGSEGGRETDLFFKVIVVQELVVHGVSIGINGSQEDSNRERQTHTHTHSVCIVQ